MKHPKVGSELDGLIARVQAGEVSAEEAASEAPLHRGDSIGVAIHLSGNVDGVVSFLEANGASNISAKDDYIEAYVPVLLLAETSEQEGVIRVRPIQPPEESQSGSVVPGNGPAVHGSTVWNQAGYTGTGIKVGVIDGGFDGLADLMGTEVPARVQARCYRGLGEHSQDLEDCGGSTHGTVVAESIMDIAPSVSLYITDPRSLGDLRDAVDWMISEGVSVINHSRTWLFDGPGDGTSPSSVSPLKAVDRAVAAGIVWVNAAGNSAHLTWFKRGPFAYSTISVDGESVRVLNFEASNFRNNFSLWGTLQLRWDDTWGGATRNLDLLLVAPDSGDITLASIDPQSGGDGHYPYERVSSASTYDVMIANRGGSEPSWIQLLAWRGQGLTYQTSDSGSTTNPAESANPGMLTVGAAHWSTVSSIESYSSRGPTPDGRIKPDLVGADCGQTATSSSPFCGTSQASPHLAGMAALVRQRFPEYSPAQVVSYLKANAEQRISSPDPNNTWGHGFMVLPPLEPQPIGSPSIQSITPAASSLTVEWIEPSSDGGSAITAYDLRHIETSADETVDTNWTVVEDVWTSGSGALSYEVKGLGGGTRYDVQVRSVSSDGDGQWSAAVTGTPLLEATPCVTGEAVTDPNNNAALVADCDALLAVRDTLAGTGTLNWSASTPIGDWDGIDVGGTPRRVTSIYLGIAVLSGTIPAELGSLTGLTQLSIFNTQIAGPIPPELGSLSNLIGLDLFENRLTGTIPKELGRLTNLERLGLNDNQLTGPIPSELASITGLEALHIDANQLTGAIPPELGRLTNLQWLTLNDNRLTGEVPDELERLTNLEQLWLSGNQFTGCVPAGLRSVGEIDRTHRLKEIGIPYCDELLSGLSIDPATLSPRFDADTVEYTVTASSSRITFSPTSGHNATFEYLDGDGNVLADLDGSQAGHQIDLPAGMAMTIRVSVIAPQDRSGWHTYTFHVTGPETLGAPAINQITPGTNSLTLSWTPPAVGVGATITAYDLRHIESSNDETVEANWTVVDNVWTSGSGNLSYELAGLSGGTQYEVQVRAVTNAADGPWSATAVSTPSPADCNTGGAVPDAANNAGLVSDCETLLAVRDALRGTGTLDWSAGRPITEWRGVTISGRPGRVTELYLSYSGLNGVIPAVMGSLARLEYLSIVGNQLSGSIPAELGNLGNLRNLSLSFNSLSGEIPAALGNLSSLEVLWLESNQLTGEIPPELGNLPNVVWLWLNQNRLSGDIPAELGNLTQLERLYLSGNQLTGCVPAGLREVAQNDVDLLGLSDCSLGPAPDLVVDAVTVDTGAPAAGARFTLSATVRNQGDGASGSTTLRYYQSADSTITTGDIEVGTDSVSGLGASGTGDESISLTAPSTPGIFYYGACVDPVPGESDATNNCSPAVTVTVGAASAPDLVVDAPTASDSAPAAGARITLKATVRNQGNGSSESTTLRWYQSTDSTITTGDTEVGSDSVAFWTGIAVSASYIEDAVLTAPSTPGTYYYGACVDAVTGETDTTNNCSPAVTVTVGAAPAPDLVVDPPTVSESAPAAGARITLNATVRNQGNGRSDSTTLRYYQSTDSTISAGDAQVDTDYVSRLDPSESGDESVRLTAPTDPGTYYLGACVDDVPGELDTTNNCSVGVQVTVGAAPAPDLVVDAPTVSDSAPAAGARITLNATVRNQGGGRSDSTTLRYYQSADSTITTGDTEVGTDSVFRLSASGSGGESIRLTAPSTPGTYYYGACVDAVSGETDTTNNCSIAVAVTVGAGPAPDLVVDTPTVDTSAPAAGARFTLSAAVRNQGSGSSAATTLRYYQSADSTITTDDTEVGTDSVSGLGASRSGDESIGLTAPSSAGTYYYGACVDTVTGESDTTNNCSAAVAVTVGAAPAPDLVVDTPTVDTSAPAAGARFTLSATVRNQGSGSSAATTLRYYRSADSTITTGDTEVGTDSVSGLGASRSGDESISLTAPSSAGTYYYGACVNSVTGESDTTNNCSAAVTVTVGAIASVPGAPTGLTATANGQTQIDLSWTAPSDDGGSAITGYRIEVSADGSSWSDLVSDTRSTATSRSHTGLTAGTTRHYRVSAISPAGTGPASNIANATTAPSTAQQVGAGTCSTDGAVPDAASNPGLVSDCEILLAARDILRGTATLNWSASIPIANWQAITVSGTPRRVTKLDTSGAGLPSELNGTIPPGLGSLTKLTILRLSNNELTGSIPPELGNLVDLRWLSLWNNALTGTIPGELGDLSDLTLLRLEWNDLTGTIPAQLGSLNRLESLYLGGNRLSGAIPAELGNLTNLQHLNLGGSNSGENQLTGAIPSQLRSLTKLKSINLWNNRISGTIPVWLGDLTDLGTLILANNKLTGTIPTQLGNLTKVSQFWLAHNQLTGTIPSELGNLTNVTELHLDDNRLTGAIPAELADLSGLRQLFLADNQLTGCIPEGLRDVAAQHDIAQLDLPDCDTASSTAVAPGAPTGLTATADGQNQIDLSWTAPSDDGGAAITGYKIEVSTGGSSWTDLVADTGSTATSYSHTGLTAGSTRHYRVSAINSAGAGRASNTDSATTEAAPATQPGAPTSLTATANGQTQIDLSWIAPSDDGGAAITGYRIEVSTDGSSWTSLVADTGSTTTSYSHTGLTAESTRHYRVSAINSAGAGPASNTDSATTAAESVADATCTEDLIVKPGESCTYPGTSTEFSVDSNGTGRFLFNSSGSKIELRNTTINGVTYTFVASKQSDGNWLVEEVG